MATALAVGGRVGAVLVAMVGRRSPFLLWSGFAVMSGLFVPLLITFGPLMISARRLSRCALIRRRLLLLESSIVFLCQKAIRLPDLLRGDRNVRQPDAFRQ